MAPKMIGVKPLTPTERSRRWRLKNPERFAQTKARSRAKRRKEDAAAALKWFYDNRERARGNAKAYYMKNAEQLRAYSRNWFKNEMANNPEFRERRRDSDRKSRYGLDGDGYRAMLLAQGARCALCSEEFTKAPCIDHNHATGAVRELLCSNCNKGIGFFRDNADLAERAADYLRRHERWPSKTTRKAS